tara:strand:+ start:3770 stop:4510 length:741 start_codon:yes stop_codon:yes gene_type:complete
MSLSPEEQSKLRKEATEQVYRDAFKDNIVSKNKYFVHIISSNCEGYVADADQNNLSFHFPVLPQGHMKNCRVKVIHGLLPRYENNKVVQGGSIVIENLIRDRTFIPIQQDGYTEALQGQSFPIATNYTLTSISHPNHISGAVNPVAATDAFRVYQNGTITPTIEAGNNCVGALQVNNIVGYDLVCDDVWRWCDNPSGKKIRIQFKNTGFTNLDLQHAGGGAANYPWTLSLMFEFFPDFNSNDRLTN